MIVDLLRLLVDTGFLILIWAVQLVIYPSFKFYSKENLLIWHRSYTKRVTIIVLPLMLGQLLLSALQLWYNQNWYTLSSAIIVIALWLITFLVFVPLHQSIDLDKPQPQVTTKLVTNNWVRVILWTILFVLTFFNFLNS